MNFEQWKKECKRIIYDQTDNDVDIDVVENNMGSVDEWIDQFEDGKSPREAVEEANQDAIDNYLDNLN